MKLSHHRLEMKRNDRLAQISPLNITERSFTTSKIVVRLPSVETDHDFFPTLKPLNRESSLNKFLFSPNQANCVKINLAKLDLKDCDMRVSFRRPKIIKSKTNFLANTKSDDSGFKFSSIRMPLPPSYYNEIEKIRSKIRMGSSSRVARNKENLMTSFT